MFMKRFNTVSSAPTIAIDEKNKFNLQKNSYLDMTKQQLVETPYDIVIVYLVDDLVITLSK